MIEKKIFLKTLEDVKMFVHIANTKKYDMELSGGKYVVNAKSIMGILSLDLTKPLSLTLHTFEDPDLETELEPYILTDILENNQQNII